MKISRRSLILGVLTTSVVAIAAPYAFYKYKNGTASEIIIAVLKRRVGYLNIDEDVYAAFVDDYLDFRSSYLSQLAKLSLIATPLRYISPYNMLDMNNPLRRLEDNIVSNFLLSTNFFQSGESKEQQLEYIGFYDPVLRPCRNPFHRSA